MAAGDPNVPIDTTNVYARNIKADSDHFMEDARRLATREVEHLNNLNTITTMLLAGSAHEAGRRQSWASFEDHALSALVLRGSNVNEAVISSLQTDISLVKAQLAEVADQWRQFVALVGLQTQPKEPAA